MRRARFFPLKLTYEFVYIIVLRDLQEQRAGRLEAERQLAEFQEQLKKVFYRQHDPGGLSFTSCR